MRQSSSVMAACASSPPTVRCCQINQPPPVLLVMWHCIIMFLLLVIKARSSPSRELLWKPAVPEHHKRSDSSSDHCHIGKHVQATLFQSKWVDGLQLEHDRQIDGRLGRRDSRDARARISIDTSALSDVPGARRPGFDSPPPSDFFDFMTEKQVKKKKS